MVEHLIEAYQIAGEVTKEREKVFQYLKDVFSVSRVPGYLTRDRYFKREKSIQLEGWMEEMRQILVEYAKKHDLSIEDIRNILKTRKY